MRSFLSSFRKKPRDNLMTVAAAFTTCVSCAMRLLADRPQHIARAPPTPVTSLRLCAMIVLRFDADGSGALDADEIKAIFTRPGGGCALSDEEALEVIREFDVNGDGVLQFEEFCVMWGRLGCDTVVSQGSFKKKPSKRPTSPDRGKPASASRKGSVLYGGGAEEAAPPDLSEGSASVSAVPTSPAVANQSPTTRKSASFKQVDPPTTVSSSSHSAEEAHALQTASHFAAAASAELSAANALTARVESLLRDQFSRRLGRALQEHKLASAATKDDLSALMREWDANESGDLDRSEFRRAVRVSLGVTATNAEIDAMFDEFDADGSGEIDLKEMRPFLIALKKEWLTAQNEIAGVTELSELSRRRASELEEVAEQMKKIEGVENWLQEQSSASHVSVRFQEILIERKGNAHQLKSVADNWRCADGRSILGQMPRDGRYLINKEVFCRGVNELIKNADGSPPALSQGEVEMWFDDELQAAREAASGQGGAGGERGAANDAGGASPDGARRGQAAASASCGSGARSFKGSTSFKGGPSTKGAGPSPSSRGDKQLAVLSSAAGSFKVKATPMTGDLNPDGGGALGVHVAGFGLYADRVDLMTVLKDAKESRQAVLETRSSVSKHLDSLRAKAQEAQEALVAEAEALAKSTMEKQLLLQTAAKEKREAEMATARAKEEAKAAAKARALKAQAEFEKSVESKRNDNRGAMGLTGAVKVPTIRASATVAAAAGNYDA